jgi:hypothetical protein
MPCCCCAWFVQVIYENRNGGHSSAFDDLLPTLSRLTYVCDLRAKNLDQGLGCIIARPAIALGNASLATTRGLLVARGPSDGLRCGLYARPLMTAQYAP